jgi:hypothetical protein
MRRSSTEGRRDLTNFTTSPDLTSYFFFTLPPKQEDMKRRVVDHAEEQQVQWLENVFEALCCENDAVGLPRLAGERGGRMDG